MKNIMKTKLIVMLIIVGNIAYAGQVSNQLLKELSHSINLARHNMEKLDAKLPRSSKTDIAAIIKGRAKAIKEFRELYASFKLTKSSSLKKILLIEMRQKNFQIMKFNTVFFSFMKNDLDIQDKQLKIIEDSLPGIIKQMDKVNELTAKANNEIYLEVENVAAHKNLCNFAEMIADFSKKYPQTNCNIIRQSIAIQNTILQDSNSNSNKIKKILAVQSFFYRKLLLQVIVARQGLQSEKEVTEQVQLCEKVDSISRETDILSLTKGI